MNKRDIKKVVLAQLSNMLRHEVIIAGSLSYEDLARADEAQHELADEFERRGRGAEYSSEWDGN